MPCGTSTNFENCSAERLTATAGASRVRIRDVEPGLIEAVLVVESRALEELRRRRIDDHANGVTERGFDVIGGDVTVEEHLVRESAASAGTNGDSQCEFVGTLGREQFLHLHGC